jgi:hypothetical protein
MRANSLLTAVIAALAITLGCSTRESSSGAVAQDSSGTPSRAGGSGGQTSAASTDSIVRGTVATVSDSVLTVSAPNGTIRITLKQPVTVYERRPGELSRVTDNSFVGVTSVPQPDGTQRATEIHIFPEELRGLGEGSRPMRPQGSDNRSTMTNGKVASSRMTNGNARMTNGAARMTNGTSRGAAAGTITVAYNGGSQTISVPPGVSVTEIARVATKLTAGTSIIVPAVKQPDGTLKTSRVMLASEPASTK